VILHVNNSNEFEDEREYGRAQAFKSWHPKNWLMKSLVIRRLYEMITEQVYWAWVPAEVRNLAAVSDADDERLASQNAAKLREWDARVRKYTAESVALARAAGAKVLLVTQAHLQRDPAGKPSLDDAGLDEMVQPLLGDGVYQLSMKQVLANKAFATLFVDSAHLNPAGHALLAEAVLAKLRQAGVVAATK
jgi:lysophospholipase L1-like esterase